jgi:hypothetical protein
MMSSIAAHNAQMIDFMTDWSFLLTRMMINPGIQMNSPAANENMLHAAAPIDMAKNRSTPALLVSRIADNIANKTHNESSIFSPHKKALIRYRLNQNIERGRIDKRYALRFLNQSFIILIMRTKEMVWKKAPINASTLKFPS